MNNVRRFLGTYRCVDCGCRVRVYDWLPEAVLCRKCETKLARQEEAAREPEEDA